MKLIKLLLTGVALCSSIVLSQAQPSFYSSGNAFPVVLSSSGQTNFNNNVTNALYGVAITNAVGMTNLVPVNPSGVGNTISIQVTGVSTAAGTMTNYVIVSAATAPVNITNNSLGWATAYQPRVPFATLQLVMNGTTPVTSNFVYTASSTPAFAGGMKLYVEAISNTLSGAGVLLTNYSVYSKQQ